jgi:hypothetical protein
MSDLEKRFPMYSRLLKLYPMEYRKKYNDQILQTTADMLDDAPSRRTRLVIWTRLAIDLPMNLGRQQFQYVGGFMLKESPMYIKRNSLIAGVLLIPFIVALLANGLDRLINNHTLYNSWLWKSSVVGFWAMWLPLLAFLIALVSYLRFVSKETKNKHTTWFRRLMNFKSSWPIFIPLIMALGILSVAMFHDDVQCWVRTPNYLVSHVDQSWRCTVNDFAYPQKLI